MNPPSHPLALVTGSAHRLGKAIALELAKQGYAIGIHYHSTQSEASKTAVEIEEMGVPSFLFQADLTSPTSIEHLMDKIEDCPCPLKVLVNCAAIMKSQNILQLGLKDWDETFNLNLRAPFFLSKRAYQLMKDRGGNIINITDSGAGRSWTGYGAYNVSKSGLESLTRLLAKAMGPQVRVNAIGPGLVLPPPDFPPSEWERLVNRTPLKKSTPPEQIASAVTYLLNNESITGQTLVIDSGYQIN